jgi:hypothetical protein
MELRVSLIQSSLRLQFGAGAQCEAKGNFFSGANFFFKKVEETNTLHMSDMFAVNIIIWKSS